MRDAAEGQQKHGQQEHIETLPLFSTTDKNGRMTMLRPGHRVGRAAPLIPWLLSVAALWALTGSVPFGALLGMAPTPAISMLLGHPVTVGVAVLLLFVAIGTTGGVYSRSIEHFGQTRVAGLFATLSVAGGLGERMYARKMVGLLLGFGGVASMSIGGLEASPSSAFCSPWDPH